MEMAAMGLVPSFPLPGVVGVASTQPTINYKVNDEVTQVVECRIQPCPEVVHDSFMQLFPGVTVESGQLHVICLSERTTHDMTSWSNEVEEERDDLLGNVCTHNPLPPPLLPLLLYSFLSSVPLSFSPSISFCVVC